MENHEKKQRHIKPDSDSGCHGIPRSDLDPRTELQGYGSGP